MEEANHIVKQLLSEMSQAKIRAGIPRTEKFYICYDHASVHSEIAQVLGHRALIWPQPSHSPECNKPIEHIHSQVDENEKGWLKRKRAEQPRGAIAVEVAKAECTRFFKGISLESIQRDVHSLPATWDAIIASRGGFIPSAVS